MGKLAFHMQRHQLQQSKGFEKQISVGDGLRGRGGRRRGEMGQVQYHKQ